jgi:hypothetical protein
VSVFGEHFFSAQDPRSYVDPVTNSALLSPVQLERDFASLLQGQLTTAALPAFLHEATHHWCFDSFVGTTLALLRLQARRRLLEAASPDSPDPDPWDVLDDFVRYESTVTFLRPLLEGMALFAEFDASPGTAAVMSQPIFWAAMNFAAEQLKKEDNFNFIGQWLFGERMMPRFLKRKATLLALPLRHSEPGGEYLSGYLVTKLLHYHLTDRAELFQDSDFFLLYLRHYLLEDTILVRELLDFEKKDIGAVAAIKEHLAKRINGLLRENQADGAERLNRFYLKEQEADYVDGKVPRIVPHGLDRTEAISAYDSMLKTFSSLQEKAGDDRWRDSLRLYDAWQLAQRELMCLGRLEVDIEVADTGRLVLKRNDKPMLMTRVREGIEGKRNGKGWLQFHVSMTHRYVVASACFEKETVFLHVPSEIEPELREQIDHYQLNQTLIEEEAWALQQLLQAFLEQHSDSKIVLEADSKTTAKEVAEFYGGNAVWFCPADRRAEARELMATDGFLSVLNGDPALVRALAVFSVAHRHVDRAGMSGVFDLCREFHEYAGDCSSAIADINRFSTERIGTELIYQTKAGHFCSV